MLRSASLFLLIAAAAVAHAEDPKASAQDPNKIICKRQGVTGSLAEATRVCHTRAEWTQLAEEGRDAARRAAESVAAAGGSGH